MRRVLLVPPTVFIISLIVFGSIRMLPGDALDDRLAEAGVPKDDRTKIRADLGLDRPLLQQYFDWMGGLVRGDLGDSIFSKDSVAKRARRALPITVELGVLSLFFAIVLGIPTGLLSALRPGTFLDLVARTLAIGGLSIPNFWLATLLIVMPAIWWGWVPPLKYVSFVDDPFDNVTVFLLPALVLSLRLGATVMRMVRSEMLEVIRADYVRTARAKGLTEYRVVTRHAFKNAAIPVVTVIGLSVANLLGGSVIMESIFGLPGLGRLMLESIHEREFMMIQSVVLLVGVFVMLVNLGVDLVYGYLNPQIRHS